MNNKYFGTALVILLFFTFAKTTSSQNLLRNLKDKAQNKIEQKIEERAEKKVDETIDNQLDKAEDAIFDDDSANESTPDNEERMMNMLQGMGFGGDPVPYEETYIFKNKIQMHIESFDSKGKTISSGEFITHLTDDSKYVAYEFVSGDMSDQGKGIFIIDPENGATIIIAEEDGEKNAIIYGLGTMFNANDQESYNDIDFSDTPENYLANPNVSKTGRTKTIAGYKCSEYTYKEDDTNTSYWITEDLKMDSNDFFSTLFKTSMYSNGMGWGYLMAGTSINEKTGEKSTMEVTEVDKNSNKSFNLSGYNVTNIGNLAVPGGN